MARKFSFNVRMRRNRMMVLALTAAAVWGCKDPAQKQQEEKAQTARQVGDETPQKAAEPAKPQVQAGMLAVFKPALPEVFTTDDNPLTEEKVNLGRKLFYDERLSKSQTLSCNSCHLLDKFGVDSEKASKGHEDQVGTRNSPTVYNAAGHFRQFWDGRSPNVEHQATQPLVNPIEMAMPDEDYILEVLNSIPGYVEEFKKVFPEAKDPVTLENLGKAIGAFERKLVTPAPWDEFIEGKQDALTDEQKEGFLLFANNGCTACHMGTLLGGQNYQKAGAVKPWPNQEDKGRFEETGEESDKMMFKVPSLRNVAKTAPYFHDGSVSSLEKAIQMMGEHQLGRQISDDDAKKIAVWMDSLTGKIPEDYIKKPELPESSDKTPKPEKK